MIPTRAPTELDVAPPDEEVPEPEGEPEEEVLVPEGEPEDWKAGRVEVTTDEVAGMLEEAVPASTV